MFVEDIVGSESKVKILRTLIEINSSLSLEDLEKETKISRGILHREVKKLENNKIIIGIRAKGKLKHYRINVYNEYSFLFIKLFDVEKIQERKNKILLSTWNLLHLLVKKIYLSGKIELKGAILFGSTARGTASLYSDIDILILISNNGNTNKLHKIANEIQKKIKNKINLNIMTIDEYNNDQKIKTSFIMEVNKDGIDLYNYFIENTRKII